jgi:hypothetical protein
MAHFAEIDEKGIVKRVIVADQSFIDSGKVGDPKNWVQTSYNGNIRKNYAGIGFSLDKSLDAFVPPKPFDSWVLDANTARWKAPREIPRDGKDYVWNEERKGWDLTEKP